MSDFVTKDLTVKKPAPDPTKHVRYTYGMVLGEDDFTQEFAYLAGRDQWLARDLLGYGTVRGLQVTVEDDATGPRVSVKPGVALSPQGQLICVTPEQCASLNAWLGRQEAAAVDERIGHNAPDGSVALYVTLCYRACPTDNVPIPGEPCRSEDNTMAASRWQDDFQLELRFEPPEQFVEDGLRQVVQWLRLTPLDSGAATPQADFLDALRSALRVDTAATPPAFAFGAPDADLRIPAAQAADFWRAAMRVWTTELRPQQLGQGTFVAFIRQVLRDRASEDPNLTSTDDFKTALRSAARLAQSSVQPGYLDAKPFETVRLPTAPADQAVYWQAAFDVWREEVLPRWVSGGGVCAVPPDEGCVLLAKLLVPLTADRTVNGAHDAVTVDEETRPFVLHLRMLQEWALTGVHNAGAGSITLAGDVSGPAGATQIDRLQGKAVAAAAPGDRQVLTFDAAGDTWLPAALPEVAVPDVALAGDVSGPAGATQIDRLQGRAVAAAAPGDRQVLTYDAASDNWIPAPVPVVDPQPVVLDGDVAGPAGATIVTRLQTVPVAPAPPAPVQNGQVLMVVNGQWQSAELPAPPQAAGDVVIHRAGLPVYAIAAAGRVRGNGTSDGPVYNRLACRTVNDGTLLLRFGSANDRLGYRLPNDSFQYVVKVLPVFDEKPYPEVSFQSYASNGIALMVRRNNEPISQAELQDMAFMIEISYYER